MHIRELLQSPHRWQQERQESNRFNNNNKKNISTLQVYKKNLFTSFPTLHGYAKFPDAIFFEYLLKSERNFPVSFRT